MCNPLAVAMAAQATATVVKGAAAAQHGASAKATAERNAQQADGAAVDAIQRGDLKQLQTIMRDSAVVAAQRVAESAGGADVNAGAAAATQRGTEAISDLDRRTVQRNATLEAYGFREQSRAFRQQGANAEAEGKSAVLGTFLGGAASIVGSGGKLLADRASSAALEKSPDKLFEFDEDGGA